MIYLCFLTGDTEDDAQTFNLSSDGSFKSTNLSLNAFTISLLFIFASFFNNGLTLTTTVIFNYYCSIFPWFCYFDGVFFRKPPFGDLAIGDLDFTKMSSSELLKLDFFDDLPGLLMLDGGDGGGCWKFAL